MKRKTIKSILSAVLAFNLTLTYCNFLSIASPKIYADDPATTEEAEDSSDDKSASSKDERRKEVMSEFSSKRAVYTHTHNFLPSQIKMGKEPSKGEIVYNIKQLSAKYSNLITEGSGKDAYSYAMYRSLSGVGTGEMTTLYKELAMELLATYRWHIDSHDPSTGNVLTVSQVSSMLQFDGWEDLEYDCEYPIPYGVITQMGLILSGYLSEGNLKSGVISDWDTSSIAEGRKMLKNDYRKASINSEIRRLQDYIEGRGLDSSGGSDSTESSLSQIADKAEALQELNGSAELLDALQILEGDELDAYAIVKNKYMTSDDLDAFKWNLILSQFAVPYRDSINDVLEQTSFKDMATKDLKISTNPYLESIAKAKGISTDDVVKSNSSEADSEFDSFVKNLQTTYDFGKIADTLGADNVLSFSPVYVDNTDQAVISDLFRSNSLFVHDKLTYFGNDVYNPDSVAKTLQNFSTSSATWSNKEGLEKIQSYSKVIDSSLPVWIQTDGVSMYNLMFVADAIRVGGYGTYDNFINTIGNSPLYVDRWGNICAKLNLDKGTKYAIVYPAYANPLFTSFSASNDDYVGVGYGTTLKSPKRGVTSSIPAENMFKSYTKTQNPVGTWYGDSIGLTVVNSDALPLNFEEAAKAIKGSETYLAPTAIEGTNVISDISLGVSDSYSAVYNAPIVDTNGIEVGLNTYSRGYGVNSGTMIPYILRVDSTRNFLINKPFLSNYTSDRSNDFKNDYYYGCLKDRISAYNSLTDLSQYDAGKKSTYSFANTLVMDKFNVNAYTNAGIYTRGYTDGSYANFKTLNDGITPVAKRDTYLYGIINGSDAYTNSNDSIIAGDVRYLNAIYGPFTANNGIVSKQNVQEAILDGTHPLNSQSYFWGDYGTAGTALSNGSGRFVLFPSMVNHSYRKGLYTDSLSHLENNYIKVLGWKIYAGNYKGFSNAFSMENMMSNSKGVDSYYQAENIWNALFLDSDNYKTFVTFNYSGEILPNNSNAFYTLTNQLKNTDAKYVNETNSKYQKYTSVAMLDQTIDIADDWSIWENINSTSSVLDDARAAAKNYDFANNQKAFFNPSPIKAKAYKGELKKDSVSANDNVNALRYYLNDQRISDVLDAYPLEDITLMAFIWLNYYFPKTSIADCIDVTPLTTHQDSDGSFESAVAEALEEATKPETPTTDSSGAEVTTTAAEVTGEASFDNSKEEGINSKLIPEDAGLTPYNMLQEDNVLRLIYTCENDSFAGDYIYSTESFSSAGEFQRYKVSANGNLVQVNVPTLLLAINKNTSGEALQYYKDLTKESEYDTTELLDKIALFFDSPVLSILNMAEGMLQALHRFVACGTLGAIYDTSYITKWILNSNYRYIYFAAIGIALAVSLGIQGVKYLSNGKERTVKFATVFLKSCVAGLVPVVLIYTLNSCLFAISSAMSSSVAEKLALVEIEQEVKSHEQININFDTQYQIFREQFEGVDDDYTELALQFLQYCDKDNKPVYSDSTVRQLYDDISYNTILAKSMAAAQIAEQKYIKSPDDYTNIPYGESSDSVPQYYYTYEEFVPVNYDKYNTSVFYYFYDWYRYQYLRYWATNTDAGTTSFSKLAKLFNKPGYKGTNSLDKPKVSGGKIQDNQYELWSDYIMRIKDAEESIASKAYGGVAYMYNDLNYTYNDFIVDGNRVTPSSKLTDIAGLSYLFNTTIPYYKSTDGGKTTKYYNGVIRYYPSITDDLSKLDLITTTNGLDQDDPNFSVDYEMSHEYENGLRDNIDDWARMNIAAFKEIYGDYTAFATTPGKSELLKTGSTTGNVNFVATSSTRLDDSRQYNKISEQALPIAQLISSAAWDSYAKSGKLYDAVNSRNTKSYSNYKFMPINLWYNYPELFNLPDYSDPRGQVFMGVLQGRIPYSQMLRSNVSDRWTVAYYRNCEVAITMASNYYLDRYKDDVLLPIAGKRIPGRIYGSENTLYRHMYDPTSNQVGDVTMTSLEKDLVRLNERIYDRALQLTEFMPGEMRDSTLIFTLALMTTFEFNQYFSTNASPVYPQSLNLDTVNMDQIMRVSFADNINTIVKEKNVIYMLCDMEGGLFVAIPVVIGEVALWLAFIFRVLLIFALFIGATILCFGHVLFPKEPQRNMWIGILTQFAAILISQTITLGSTLVLFSTLRSGNGWFVNIIKALCIMIAYVFVCLLNFKMLTALIANFKEFGGDVFARSIEAARAHVDALNSSRTHTYASNVNVNLTPEQRTSNRVAMRNMQMAEAIASTGAAVTYNIGHNKNLMNAMREASQPMPRTFTSMRGNQSSLSSRPTRGQARQDASNALRSVERSESRGRFRLQNRDKVKYTGAKKMSYSAMRNLTDQQKQMYLAQTAVRAKYNSNTQRMSKMKERQLSKALYTYMETGKCPAFANKEDLRQMSTVIRELRSAPIEMQARQVSRRVQRL